MGSDRIYRSCNKRSCPKEPGGLDFYFTSHTITAVFSMPIFVNLKMINKWLISAKCTYSTSMFICSVEVKEDHTVILCIVKFLNILMLIY